MDQPALTSRFTLAYAYKRSLGPVIGAFMTGLRDQRILGARTADGRVIVPARAYDPASGEPTGDLVEVGPSGVIETMSHVAAPRGTDPLQVPFAWALIRLDGADTSFLHVVEGPAEALHRGLRVTARWRAEREGSLRDIAAFVP